MVLIKNARLRKTGGSYVLNVPKAFVDAGLAVPGENYDFEIDLKLAPQKKEKAEERETLKKVGQTAQSDAPVVSSGSDVLPAFFDIASRFPVSFVERGGV